MEILSSRRSIIFMMSLSVGFLVAAVTSFLFVIPDPNVEISEFERTLRPAVDQATGNLRAHNPYDYSATGLPIVASALPRIYPYRWLTPPLTIVGVVFLSISLYLYYSKP
jgi:hypothetical protein